MKIGNTRQLGQTAGKRPASMRAGSGFALDGTEAGRGAAALSGPASLTAVDALLALQEAGGADDALHSPRRAIARGEQMLDILDDIKVALLGGQVPQAKLQRLLRAVESEQAGVRDPELADILGHIELRARVELAKFGTYTED
jgi:hypothetical protein